MNAVSDDSVQSQAAAWLVGGGEMGERMRALDWPSTPLGPTETWPQSLRSAVSILLPSKAQIVLFWGPDYVTLYNDAYRPVFGGKHPWALGAPGSKAWREIWPDMLGPLLDGVVTTGEAFWAKDLMFALERHGYAEETYFDVSYDPVRDETGNVGGVFCIVSETTGRVVGERRLAALRDLGRIGTNADTIDQVLMNAMEVLRHYDKDIPFAAIYRCMEHSSETVIKASYGLSCPVNSLGFDLPRWQTPIDFDDGALTTFEPNADTPTGPWPEAPREALILKIASPGAGSFGYLVAGISARRKLDEDYRDFLRMVVASLASAITSAQALDEERKRAAALAEIDRAKTVFFSNVSHEFRTPLTLMLGPLEDLLSTAQGPERTLLQVVERNGQRLLRLVNTLLDFARIEAGRVQCRFQATDLALLTADLASNFRSACERAGLALSVDCAPCSELAYVDRDIWEKIVLNLLSNAFKFTFTGNIAVTLRESSAHFELNVRDTGSGIPSDALPRIFDRFHRVETVRGRSFEGSGIGLALVNELCRLHGGTISVQSEIDTGSLFTVSIPKGFAHLPREQVLLDAPHSTHHSSRKDSYLAEALSWLPDAAETPNTTHNATERILLADDNADMREYARRLLGEHFAVEAVADGRAALEAARQRRPELIISDIMMPNLDGYGLLKALRADDELCTVPVILLSARAGEEARIEGLNAGADDYIVKPFSSRELLVRAGSLIKSADIHRRAREMLHEADARKDEFLATLSHELRNPLAALRTSLQLLKLETPSAANSGLPLEIMDRQVAHLVRLVDDLLEVSRITRGNVELRKGPISLEVALNNALETSSPLIRAGSHLLNVTLPAESIVVDADPVRLAQVFGNLLNNAAKYSDSGGTISVTARREGQEAVVAIQDTGDGIEPKQLPQLFKFFSRGQSSDRRHQSGLGIGLALVRRLVEMHGGQVEAASDGLGLGSCFTVRLPICETHPLSPAPDKQTRNPHYTRAKILIVDDNQDAAESLSMLLSQLGADVLVAQNGIDALSLAESHRPRLVLLDIGMPVMDGYEVARRLRAAHGDSMMLAALTGWGQEADRERARKAGFDVHLVKPVEFTAFESLLAALNSNGEKGALLSVASVEAEPAAP